jgi:hypothetical protein
VSKHTHRANAAEAIEERGVDEVADTRPGDVQTRDDEGEDVAQA